MKKSNLKADSTSLKEFKRKKQQKSEFIY